MTYIWQIILQFQRLFQSLMISQIRCKTKANTTTSFTKNSKTISLLGMDLQKFKKQQIIPKHREIDNLKINIRSSNENKNIYKNDCIDNNSSQYRNHSFQTSILSLPQLHQNNENIIMQQIQSEKEDIFQFLKKKQIVPQITNSEINLNIEDKIFDESINNEPSFLTLENITNQEGHVDQVENKKYLTSLNNIFMEDIKTEKQNEDKNKNRNIYVDMKKKIKKLCKTQKLSSREQGCGIKLFKSQQNDYLQKKKSQLTIIHNQMLKNIYKDTDVIVDGCIFRNKTVPQRIDNDVDTDDEQINSGIRRLHKSLFQVVEQNMHLTQKIDIVSFKPFRQIAQNRYHCLQDEQDN